MVRRVPLLVLCNPDKYCRIFNPKELTEWLNG